MNQIINTNTCAMKLSIEAYFGYRLKCHFNILKDFRNAPAAKMLFFCQNVVFCLCENKIDKSLHLACIQ